MSKQKQRENNENSSAKINFSHVLLSDQYMYLHTQGLINP